MYHKVAALISSPRVFSILFYFIFFFYKLFFFVIRFFCIDYFVLYILYNDSKTRFALRKRDVSFRSIVKRRGPSLKIYNKDFDVRVKNNLIEGDENDNGLSFPAEPGNVSLHLPLCFLARRFRASINSGWRWWCVSASVTTFCYLLWKRRECILHYLAQSAEKMEINGTREKRDNDVRGGSGSTRRVS